MSESRVSDEVTSYWDPKEAFAQQATDPNITPADVYADLLEEKAVERVSAPDGFWGVFTYEDVVKVAGDYKTFSSVTPRPGGERVLPLEVDPPEHAQYRRMMNPPFAPDKIDAAEKEIRPLAAAMVETLVEEGEGEFADFAYEFAIRALCSFLKIDDVHWTYIREWHHKLFYELDANVPGRPGRDEIVAEFIPFMLGIVNDRRQNPGDDAITAIIDGEIDGAPLDDVGVVGLTVALFMAGFATTTGGMGNLVGRVANDPELQSYLRAHPERVADAVEESLRIDAPQQAMHRVCAKDTELGGKEIKAGEYVQLNYGSANVDECKWANAAKFDLDREDKHQHLAFGRGIHKCYGAPLARMEMRVLLEELLARTESFAIAGPIERLTWPGQKMDKLPLSFVPAGADGEAE